VSDANHERPLVSVIMAAYNSEEFIRPALESVLAQDWDPFEVIVVDDGSTDATADIAESYARVRCIRQANAGPATARNTAIAAAAGELVANFDSDDLLPPTRLSVQASYLLAHPDVGCVFGRQEWLNAPSWLARDAVYGDIDGIPLSSAMFRREVLAELGGYDARFEPSEDTDLLIRIREAGIPYHVLPDIVLYRRFHGSSLTEGRSAPHTPLLHSLRAKLARERTGPGGQQQ
jgi:glycosyltransferase involved in cell wall biosynthesis